MDNWNNWGSNNNEENNTPSYGQENNTPYGSDTDDDLDVLLAEEESQNTDENSGDSVLETTTDVNETPEVVENKSETDTLVDSFEVAPTSAKNTPVFSERQVYRIINLSSVMDYCDEEKNQIIATIFGVRGKNVRKAMTLVEADTTEIDNKIVSVTVLKKILQSATGEGIDDPMDFAIDLFSQVSSMDGDQLTAMISLVKSFQDEANEKRIRINRSTPAAEIIKEIKAALEVDDVALAAEATSGVIDLVHEALK